MIMKLNGRSAVWLVLFLSRAGFSADTVIPDCLAGGLPLANNNVQVLQWKTNTNNQYRNRGHVSGPIEQIYPNINGHAHFEIQIGDTATDTLEVIYNESFGPLPELKTGMNIEACGDYITSTAQSGPYPPSPTGAIIHWIHRSPNLKKHDSGYLAIDGILYGQDAAHAGPKPHYPAPAPGPSDSVRLGY